LLTHGDTRAVVDALPALLTATELAQLQLQVQNIHASEPLINYLQDLIAATRSGSWFLQGLSPRAGIALLRAAKAQALLSGRDYVAPDDLRAVMVQTVAHRLHPISSAGRNASAQVRSMLDAVALS
jgi:MoxR-like ATPase